MLLPVRQSAAQAVQSQGVNTGGADLNLIGTITSSITISVTGSLDTNGGATTTISGSGTQGIVDFGTYDLAGPLANGDKQRVNLNPKGNYLVATLTVQTTFSGSGSMNAAVDIQRANPCGAAPDVSCAGSGSLFYGKMTPRIPNVRGFWTKWTRYPEIKPGVSPMPISTYVPGAGNLDSSMLNGQSVDHQVAVWIPDSLPAGPFSTVVTYTVTRL